MTAMTDAETIAELKAKIVRLQGARTIQDYLNDAGSSPSNFPVELLAVCGPMTLAEFVARLTESVKEKDSKKKVGGLQAIADVLGLPTGPDGLYTMPGPDWEPRKLL